MKAKAWGAVVMVAFAWVLWKNDLRNMKKDFWAMEGYETREDCDKGRKALVKDSSNYGLAISISPSETVPTSKAERALRYKLDDEKRNLIPSPKGSWMIETKPASFRLVCLPSDIDPRPPK